MSGALLEAHAGGRGKKGSEAKTQWIRSPTPNSSTCNFHHHMTRILIPTFFLQFLPEHTIKYPNWHGILLTCHDFLLKIQKTMLSLWGQFMHLISILFIETKQNFDWNLCNHLLARILGCEFNSSNDHSFTGEDRAPICFNHGCIYKHKTARINFMTYDLRREQDLINPRTEHQDIMVLAHEDASCEEYHPYWYAPVIRILYADVYHTGEKSTTDEPYKMDFLWVCWFGLDESHWGGWKARQLHWIGFFNSEDKWAFGFLDPNEIIQAVHLIPAFTHGLIDNLPSDSLAHHSEDEYYEEWKYHYVHMYV